LLVFMRYRQRWAQFGAPPGEVGAAVLWLFLITALAALSKENGALLPWLIVTLEVCIFRGTWAGRSNNYLRRAGLCLLISPVILVAILLSYMPEVLTAGYSGREFTLEERVLTQGRLLWRYLGWLVIPNIWDMGFQHDDIPVSNGFFVPYTTMLSLTAWGLLFAVSIVFRRRCPILLLAVLFFLVGHGMESTVLPLEMVYEHRNYLPGMLICLALASALVLPFSESKKVNRWYLPGGAMAIIFLLLAIRVHTWSDELTLSYSNVSRHPESSRSNYFYANALLRHFRRGDQLGLTEREKGESLILSRHYFERMYQTNSRDVSALVMLYYLDSRYFNELQQEIDWLALLEELLASRHLQPSDWNALTLLFEVLASETKVNRAPRVMALLDVLAERYPASEKVVQFRYQYLSSTEPDHPELMPLLERAQILSPGATWVYHSLLLEASRRQDIAGMYEHARTWMINEPGRRDINQIKSLFVAGEAQSGDPGD